MLSLAFIANEKMYACRIWMVCKIIAKKKTRAQRCMGDVFRE